MCERNRRLSGHTERIFLELLTLVSLYLPESAAAAAQTKSDVAQTQQTSCAPIFSQPFVSPYFTDPNDPDLQKVINRRLAWGDITQACLDNADGYFATRNDVSLMGRRVVITMGDGTRGTFCVIDIQQPAHEAAACPGYLGDVTFKNGKAVIDKNRFGVAIYTLEGRQIKPNKYEDFDVKNGVTPVPDNPSLPAQPTPDPDRGVQTEQGKVCTDGPAGPDGTFTLQCVDPMPEGVDFRVTPTP